MTTHTPGPWEIHGDTTSELFYVHGNNAVCDIRRGGSYSPWCDSRFSRTPREDDANANLIAAAPDLLAACKAMLEWYGNCGSPAQQEAANNARAAIRKAEKGGAE